MNAAAAMLSLQCLLFSTVVLTREPSIVWKRQDFSGIHILREIIFESLEGMKLSFLPIELRALNFVDLLNVCQKVPKFIKI